MNARGFVAASVAALTLAACSGGGSASAPVVPAQAVPQSSGRATLSIFVPSRTSASASSRTPSYVSANATQLQVAANNTTVATIALGPAAPSCTAASGGYSCSAFIELPAGNDTIVATLLDPNNFALATNTITQTIVAGQTNVINLTLNAVVASVAIAPIPAQPVTLLPDGSYQLSVAGGSATFAIALLDATGATIVGTNNPTAQPGTPSGIVLLPGTCPLAVPSTAVSPQIQLTLTPATPFATECTLQAQVNGITVGVTPALSAQ